MGLTPLQKRAERRARNQSMVDLNLVSLIDVFTILIFFLLSNVAGPELLPSPKATTLPESTAKQEPRAAAVVTVNATEITVDGKRIAAVADVLASDADLIAPLDAALKALPKPTGDAAHALTIMGDKDIPYQLLRKVMATAARADYTDVSFAVRKKVRAA